MKNAERRGVRIMYSLLQHRDKPTQRGAVSCGRIERQATARIMYSLLQHRDKTTRRGAISCERIERQATARIRVCCSTETIRHNAAASREDEYRTPGDGAY